MLTLAGLLTACAGPVEVADPAPDPATAAVCDQVLAALPDRVADQDRRATRPGRYTAAWGDPAISLRCGVPQPAAQNAASECFEVNGVGWFAEQAEGGYLFTTIGRAAYVEVGVPAQYRPQADALVDVAAAVGDHDPVRQPCV